MNYAVFDLLNQQLANPFLDAVLPIYRDKLTWIPLYVLIAFLLLRTYGWQRTLYLLLCLAAVILVADQLAASVIKPWVGQLRPCADPQVADRVRKLVSCGGQYGFPSNHATNHFAMATVLSLTWLRNSGWKYALLLWALTISLAQVYVGKHYPVDILGGALLGAGLALLGTWLYGRAAGAMSIRGSKNNTEPTS